MVVCAIRCARTLVSNMLERIVHSHHGIVLYEISIIRLKLQNVISEMCKYLEYGFKTRFGKASI